MKRLAELEAMEAPVVEEKQTDTTTLQDEIDCPRCGDIMLLCSGFDYLYYSCDECGFVLSYLKK